MSIARYMVDEIAIAPYTGDDNVDGLPQYGATAIYKARIEEKLDTVRRADGTTVNTTTAVATIQPVSIRDRVWIAPFTSNSVPRTFGSTPTLDADARTPVVVKDARKRGGGDGHFETLF